MARLGKRLSWVAAAMLITPPIAFSEDQPSRDPAPALGSADVDVLSEVRDSIKRDEAKSEKRVPEPADAERWQDETFKAGVRKAAKEGAVRYGTTPTPSRPPERSSGYNFHARPYHPPATASYNQPTAPSPQPRIYRPGPDAYRPKHAKRPDWVVVLESARRLEEMAHELDMRKLWDEARALREAAGVLRESARERAQKAAKPPFPIGGRYVENPKPAGDSPTPRRPRAEGRSNPWPEWPGANNNPADQPLPPGP